MAVAARVHHRADGEPDDADPGSLVALLRDVDWRAMIVARKGLAWLEQNPAQCEALCSAHMPVIVRRLDRLPLRRPPIAFSGS